MERLSVFDIYKIGVGPSSSHTLGPWKAARSFLDQLKDIEIKRIQVKLYGSLSKTGRGHGTDVAVILGLLDYDPVTIDTSSLNHYIATVRFEKSLVINNQAIVFDPDEDIIFAKSSLDYHPNALEFVVSYKDNTQFSQIFYSTGGGFIEKEGALESNTETIELPFPIDNADQLLEYTKQKECRISDIVYQNELVFNDDFEIRKKISQIHNTILECVHKGCHTEGILPGGLNVKRRAQNIASTLLPSNLHNEKDMIKWLNHIKNTDSGFSIVNKWISCFALAVNEENAAFGRVVTSPTNGAAGVIPAVLLYYICFCEEAIDRAIERFFYTSGEIGSLFKKGATISAAMGGCQAEIGVSSSMAAGALTEILGGSPKQVLMAAEIAMEHHLGLTCDPIGGLVQIPCIERNAMGAMKAITAANIALTTDPDSAIVSLDTVIKTMWETAQDMNNKYKETAEGGLAINLPVIQPSC